MFKDFRVENDKTTKNISPPHTRNVAFPAPDWQVRLIPRTNQGERCPDWSEMAQIEEGAVNLKQIYSQSV